MDIKEIQELIKFVSKSGVSEVELESKGFKITIKTPPYKRGAVPAPEVQIVQAAPAAAPAVVQAAPAAAPAPAAVPAAAPAEDKGGDDKTADNGNYDEVKSPMIGTFYRSSSPVRLLRFMTVPAASAILVTANLNTA